MAYNAARLIDCPSFNFGREAAMKLNAPTQIIFLVALVLAVVALLAVFSILPVLPVQPFWIMTAAFVVLALATLVPGL